MFLQSYISITIHCLQDIKIPELLLEMYLTLKEKFYANNLFNSIKKYVQSCHTCHTRSAKESGYKSYHTRIPYDFRPMSRISADIKWMPLSSQGFNYILFATCEISNYVIGILYRKQMLVLLQKPYSTE